jgi:hypothetical protein
MYYYYWVITFVEGLEPFVLAIGLVVMFVEVTEEVIVILVVIIVAAVHSSW